MWRRSGDQPCDSRPISYILTRIHTVARRRARRSAAHPRVRRDRRDTLVSYCISSARPRFGCASAYLRVDVMRGRARACRISARGLAWPHGEARTDSERGRGGHGSEVRRTLQNANANANATAGGARRTYVQRSVTVIPAGPGGRDGSEAWRGSGRAGGGVQSTYLVARGLGLGCAACWTYAGRCFFCDVWVT